MTKFYGAIGYADGMQETSPGVYREVITEHKYYGDISRVSLRVSAPDVVNPELSANHQLSVIADAYALSHFFNIRYVEWSGTKWTVTSAEVTRPRLTLYIGAEYHGETAD